MKKFSLGNRGRLEKKGPAEKTCEQVGGEGAQRIDNKGEFKAMDRSPPNEEKGRKQLLEHPKKFFNRKRSYAHWGRRQRQTQAHEKARPHKEEPPRERKA